MAAPVGPAVCGGSGAMRKVARVGWTIAAWLGIGATSAPAQDDPISALAGATKAAESAPKDEALLKAPTRDNPEATVAETAGPIKVSQTVGDETIRRKLLKLLPHFPGVRAVDVQVDNGVVTLAGHVEDNDVRDRLRDFVRRVEGVTLVLNRTKTDAQVLTARQYAVKQIAAYWDVLSRKWLLAILAVLFVAAAAGLARLFGKFGEVILRPFSGNALLRSVLGSVVSGLILLVGILAALNVLGLTEAVLSFLGLAGVVALAIGFAFRDIAENFIASVLLGVRRPFRVGDFIEIAGQKGIVRALNTRATVLVTLDGAQVRIPNAKVFKEVQINRTASSSVRTTFDVFIPYDASTTRAQEAIGEALGRHDAILKDPAPRALVEELTPDAVRLRVYFWTPAQGVDGYQISSDARLKAKVALREAGIAPGSPPQQIALSRPHDAAAPESNGTRRAATPDGGHDGDGNLRRDARVAAESGDAAPPEAARHAMNFAEDRVGDEGEDLIERPNARDE